MGDIGGWGTVKPDGLRGLLQPYFLFIIIFCFVLLAPTI